MPAGRLPKTIHSRTYKRLVDRLVAARKEAELTQVEVAKKLDKPQPFVSKCESGERRIDVVEFLYLCRLYGIDPCEVIREIEPAKKAGRKTKK
jgi:transcriptional regulator with XRE-family HTH domain